MPSSSVSLSPAEVARRLVVGSPLLTRIKPSTEEPHCKRPPIIVKKKSKDMPESPLFVPKRSSKDHMSSKGDSSSYRQEKNSMCDQPYRQFNNKSEAYENVVITSRPYTCQGLQYYQYTPKDSTAGGVRPHQAAYENLEHVQFPAGAFYPQRQMVRYTPHREVPILPTGHPPPAYPPRRSPHVGADTTTSGYSSYEHQTLSLHRPLPAMHEETLQSAGGATPSTFNRTHQKYIVDAGVLRQYFCVALTACIMCPPCGFWSLYQAFKVDDMVDRGNFLGAERLARKVKRYSVVMLAVGAFWVTITVTAFFLLLHRFKK